MSEWTADEEIGVSERDGPDLDLRQRGALWLAEWSFEHSMWYLWNTEDPSETRWDEWIFVNREGLDNPQAAGGTRSAERSFWWNSRTGVSSWYPPKDPTRRTCAVCKWQRFVATCLIACRRMSLYYIAKQDEDGIEHLKRLEDNRGVNLEEMD